MSQKLFLACILVMSAVIFSTAYSADVETLPAMTVVGGEEKAAISTSTEALPGSVLIIDSQQIDTMPVTNYLDLFRKQPGMNTQPYGQGGIADGLAMRGCTSGSHTNQIAVHVDGVPMNMPNHGQAHGYGDFAWITPEMVERIEIIKGPISALYGNFALCGAVNIITKSRNAGSSAGAEIGSYKYMRAVGTYNETHGNVTPFLMYEFRDKEGYRDNSEDTRYNLYNKATIASMGGDVSIVAHLVNEEWDAPGYILLDDVINGVIPRTAATIPIGSSQPSDGGDSNAINLAIRYDSSPGESGWHGTVYLSDKELNRYSSFNSPQSLNHNENSYFGWNVLYNFLPGNKYLITVGTDGRYDDMILQSFPTLDRDKTGAVNSDWDINELSIGLFAQAQYQILERVKLHGGLRYDTYDSDITNNITPANSGTGNADLLSPKLGITWSPSDTIVIYANSGQGFRTPEVSEISPVTGNANFDLNMPKIVSTDVGFNVLFNPQVSLDFNYYWSTTEDEINVIAEEAVNVGEIERNGFDMILTYNPTSALSLFVTYSAVDAKNKTPSSPDANKLSGLPENYLTVGGTWFKPLMDNARVVVDLYGQQLGDTPLNSTGSTMRDPFWRYMGKVSFDKNRWSTYAAFVYQPDEDTAEPMFDFGGVFYAPIPKLEAEVGFKYFFG